MSDDFKFFDVLDEIIANSGSEVRGAEYAPVGFVAKEPAEYLENCKACRGSGKFRSYTGRLVGNCFKCKGAGKLKFKTSSETRAKARVNVAVTKAKKIADFITANPDVYKWLNSNPNFEFATSLLNRLSVHGDLTDGQLAAAQRIVDKIAAKKAEQNQHVAPVIDVSRIEVAFNTAKENGVKRPKLRLGEFKFATAPVHGMNAGAIYVNSGETYLGKVVNGSFKKAYVCTTIQEQEILRVAANADAESKAYGLRTGSCSCCGRTLTDGVSIEMGIGPICAEKFGF